MSDLNISGNMDWSERVLALEEYASDAELAGVELYKDYPDPLIKFASVCCVIYMLIGIPGNLITIIALTRCKKVRNATAIFIINLSVSDLLFCCFNLPLAASTFWRRSWTHGKILCRMFPFSRYALVAVSLFTVLAITINRYVMISHPRLYPKLYQKWSLCGMIACLWIVPFGSLITTYLEIWGRFSLDPITGSCTIIPDEHEMSPKKFLFISAFALPTIGIIVCYARILWIVRKTANKSRGPIRIRPLTEIEETNTEIPDITIQQTSDEVIQRRNEKPHRILPCIYCPEPSSSGNDSSSREENDNKCAPEFNGAPLNSERARRIRQSFVATFRRSTAYIRPRLPTKRDKKLLTMIVAIITAFLVCHLPITLTKTIFPEFSSHPYSNIVGYILIYLTTCINPIIYVVMSSEYRKAYKSVFKFSR